MALSVSAPAGAPPSGSRFGVRSGSRAGVTMLSFLLLALLVVGCGGEGADEQGETERRFVSLGTAPPGGAFFVVGGALAEVLDQSGGERWRVTAEATKGSQENIRRLGRGELDLALANAAISYFAFRGEGGWEQPYDLRAVMTLAPNVGLFITPSSSGVKSIGELKGRRVVVGPAGAGFDYFLRPLLKAHGVNYSDFTPLNGTQAAAVDMLSDGSASAAFLGGAVPTASVTQATSTGNVRFVPYEDKAIESLVAQYEFFDRAVIPAGTYRNQTRPFQGLNVGSMHLITSAAADEQLIYEVTKTIWEHREDVVERHPAGRAINPQVAIRNTGVPFHRGAVRFFREIGIWVEPEPAPSETPAAPTPAPQPR